MAVTRITGIALVVADVARSHTFYAGLGFVPGGAGLRLGDTTLDLVAAGPGAAPYPRPAAANDPWLQHFAIRVGDMAAAYARLVALGHQPISVDGPQRLPPNTGSVTAYKFRDPDGHPLELSFDPARPADAVFAEVDHTAVAVADLAAAIAFYEGLGFAADGRSLNTGIEQDRLDGLDKVAVDIVVLRLPGSGPHIELLHYRTPAAARSIAVGAGDIAATRTSLAGPPADLIDPDGHRLEVRPENGRTV